MSITWLGLIAGTITSAGFVPQIIKAVRTKETKDLAIMQPIVLSLGIFLWLLYGILLKDIAIILANGFALLCNLTLVLLKIIYGR